MNYDRDEVLARTDLRQLADEHLGPHKGRGLSASWPCPHPGHGNQTGRTPPVTIYARNGIDRWHCHACGGGGTAADLLMHVDGLRFAEALEQLAKRIGVEVDREFAPARREAPTVVRADEDPLQPSPAIEEHVAACEAYLWSADGGAMRHWLARRGFTDEALHANRVGADPGPRALPRIPGLPRGGPAVTFPVLDAERRAVYLQARYLTPRDGRKYANPSTALAGPSPRVAVMVTPGEPMKDAPVLVCEGIPDALSVAQSGFRAAAVLGAGLPDQRVATSLAKQFGTDRLVIAFDADNRGQLGSTRLAELLRRAGADRVAELAVPAAYNDLNGWLLMAKRPFPHELAEAVSGATKVADRDMPVPSLPDALAKLHYEHVLVDDPAVAASNLSRIHASLAAWSARPALAAEPDRTDTSALSADLDTLAYQYLLRDPAGRNQSLAAIRETVNGWSFEPPSPSWDDRWETIAQSHVPALEAAAGIDL